MTRLELDERKIKFIEANMRFEGFQLTENTKAEELFDADIKSFEGDPTPLMELIEKHMRILLAHLSKGSKRLC